MIPERQELINQEETDNEIAKISDALILIFKSDTKKLSYQKTYHSVYRLCKQGLHQELVDLAINKTGEFFKDCINNMTIRQGHCGEDMSKLIARLMEASQRIMEIFLYLQANHRQRQGVPSLRILLNNLLFENLSSKKQLMEQFVKEIADLKINEDYSNSKNLITMINKIDEKQIFIPQLFLPTYIPRMKDFYRYKAHEKINNSLNLGEFIEWASNAIDSQRNFITSILHGNKPDNKRLIENVLNQIYEVCVSKNKEYIYNKNPKSLFMEYTPKILELFNKVENDDIRLHNDWYIGIVRNQLNMIPKAHNQEFLELFIKIYKKIFDYLQGTVKEFNITYKVKFIFEEWINDERINIPNRLNHYIDGSLQEYSKEKQNINFDKIVENCGIIFKLLKKKDQFERGYRKALIKRTINKKFTDPQSEVKLLAIMALECGNQWIQKISNLKESIMTHTNLRESSYQRINCLVFEETAWPFEKENFNALICKQLTGLGSEFENKYLQQNKRKKLTFHPVLGTVKMNIKFQNQSLLFLVDTGMANLIIFYKNKNRPFKIEEFVKERYYTSDQIKQSLNRLLKSELFISNNSMLELNNNYYQAISGSKSMKNISTNKQPIDLTHEENYDPMECDEMEQLRADRKMMVQAMLVKIMKSSKVSNKPQIMTKIAPMIEAKGFKFNEQFVNSSIARLIDKDFIRDFQDGTFGYIA